MYSKMCSITYYGSPTGNFAITLAKCGAGWGIHILLLSLYTHVNFLKNDHWLRRIISVVKGC